MKTEAGPPELSAPPEPARVGMHVLAEWKGLFNEEEGFTNKEPRPYAEQIEEGG